MKVFKHGFTNVEQLKEIKGYTKALQSIVDYLGEVTGFNPEKRYIDSVPLLDLISETNKELINFVAKFSEVKSDKRS